MGVIYLQNEPKVERFRDFGTSAKSDQLYRQAVKYLLRVLSKNVGLFTKNEAKTFFLGES